MKGRWILWLAAAMLLCIQVVAAEELTEPPMCSDNPDSWANDPFAHNPFITNLVLSPSKTFLLPGESFYVDAVYNRWCYCPHDFFKVFRRDDGTGVISEVYRWSKPYWQLCWSGGCTQRERITLAAPNTGGRYTIKFVGASGHIGGWNCWWCTFYDGGQAGKRPEDMGWNANYDIGAEFSILVGPIPATVDIDPDTLNIASGGDENAVTAYIELLSGFDVNNIDVATVKLSTANGEVAAQDAPTEVGDYDLDGTADRMVKFPRQAVIGIVSVGDQTMKITGSVGGIPFEGSDTIRVISKGK